MVTVVRKHSYTHACDTFTSCSYYLSAAFILFKSFEGGHYSKKYGMYMCPMTGLYIDILTTI